MATFTRPVGAQADVKELEYISALHQTCVPDTRANGTISSLDIQRLLSSRYGLTLSHVECIDILRGLGGGDAHEEFGIVEKSKTRADKIVHKLLKAGKGVANISRSNHSSSDTPAIEQGVEVDEGAVGEKDDLDYPEEYFDLVQMLSILLIPALKRAKEDKGESTQVQDASSQFASSYLPFQSEEKKEEAAKDAAQSLRPMPNIIRDVLKIMLRNLALSLDDADAPVLDSDMIEAILLDCGETEAAADKTLIQEMVDVALSGSGKLDEESFAKALTSDLDAWEVGSEDRLSTIFFDVFNETRAAANARCGIGTRIVETESAGDTESSEKQVFDKDNSIDHSNIDYVVDTHSSVFCIAVVWFFYLMVSVTYASIFQALVIAPCKDRGQGDEFGCLLAGQLYNWIVIAVFLSLMGVATILPLSLGNNPYVRTPRRLLVSCVVSLVYALLPFALVRQYIRESDKPYDGGEARANSRFFTPYLYITCVTGLFLATFYFLALMGVLVYGSGSTWLTPSNTNGEARLKQAATRKMNKLISNAHGLHEAIGSETVKAIVRADSVSNRALTGSASSSLSTVDKTMLNYVLRGERLETAASFTWTWRLLFTGQLFDTEGIWLPTRLLIFQGGQVVGLLVVAMILLGTTQYAADEAEKAQGSLPDDLPNWARQLVPTKSQVQIALYPATFTAISVMVLTILLYIPSATATILQYRCGLIPSLGSVYFRKFRSSVDSAYMNTANALYGLFGSSLLFFFIVGLVIFLFVWDFSQLFMIKLTAWGIGLGATIGAKMFLTSTCRREFFRSFYRTRPRAANLSTLALETWFMGLGGSVLIGRVSQFLFAAVFWVGRIDVPFLSENVEIAGYTFDLVPTNFAKELLVHEAHRHPFIERLSQMYLMRFHHRQDFVSRAGAAWRRVFVQTLLPWMRKHRVFRRERYEQSIVAFALNKQIAEEEAKGIAERLGEDMNAAAESAAGAGHEVVDGLMTTAETTTAAVGNIAGNVVGFGDKAVKLVTGQPKKDE